MKTAESVGAKVSDKKSSQEQDGYVTAPEAKEQGDGKKKDKKKKKEKSEKKSEKSKSKKTGSGKKAKQLQKES